MRLRYAYFVKCTHAVKDAAGNVIEVHATYDPNTRGGDAPDGRKVKSTIHWVSARHAIPAKVRLYDRLFRDPDPEAGEGFLQNLNPASLEILPACQLEASLAEARPGEKFQFERIGYFCADADGTPGKPIFNRAVSLKDTWAKVAGKG